MNTRAACRGQSKTRMNSPNQGRARVIREIPGSFGMARDVLM